MLRYFLRRVLFALVLVAVVASGAFLLTRLAPGDVTAEMVQAVASADAIARERARYGLDRPLAEHYADWLRHSLQLDFGRSFLYGRPVGGLIAERALNTAVLAAAALLLATSLGVPLGVFTGTRRRGLLPAVVRSASIVFLSVPPLILSLTLALVAARTGWLPIGGMSGLAAGELGGIGRAGDIAWHLVAPTLALALPMAATLERLQSQAMAETIRSPFVVAAAARGVPPWRIVWRGALRDSLRPVMGVYGIIVGSLFSGSFAVEIVTAWPGLGRLLFDGLLARDINLVAGCAAAGSLFLVAGTLAADLALLALDPRIAEPEIRT